MIAPRSSIIAKAVKNTFKDNGTLDPNNDKIPIEKAISVAEGIAHPRNVSGVSKFIKIYIKAGTNIPPTAAIIGRIACFTDDNSPCMNSLLISKVTKKKKMAIKPSLIQCNTLNLIPKFFIPTNIYLLSVLK